eukprot:5023851-Prymnesium_polylepis.1
MSRHVQIVQISKHIRTIQTHPRVQTSTSWTPKAGGDSDSKSGSDRCRLALEAHGKWSLPASSASARPASRWLASAVRPRGARR